MNPTESKEAFRVAWDRAALKLAHSRETQDSYWGWTRRLHVFTGRRGSATWTGKDWEAFEWHLAGLKPALSYSSRLVARMAMNFVFNKVLRLPVGKLDLPKVPKPQPALVIVPTREELRLIFGRMSGLPLLACRIMHGSGARVKECCRLRVKDIDLDRCRVQLWGGKGEKHRESVLPRNLRPALEQQLAARKRMHELDVAAGNGFVELPERCARKFKGQARKLGWQWLLPSGQVKEDGRRWYLSPDTVGDKLREAVEGAGIVKRVVCHSLRKAFATEAMEAGQSLRTIQALLGHADIQTTADHYLAIDLRGAFSPADLPDSRFVQQFTAELPQPFLWLDKEAA